MRVSTLVLSLLFMAQPTHADEKKLNPREIDKQLFDLLKEIHNQGADLYNLGDAVGSYRLFQGSLKTVRAVLIYRPADQKFIDDILADAAKRGSVQLRAFALHESIEKLRARLRIGPNETEDKKEPEKLSTPRELKPETKEPVDKPLPPKETEPAPEKKPVPKAPPLPPPDGVSGRIYWQGQPVTAIEVAFVSRGVLDIRVVEGASNAEGQYALEGIVPGKYTVLLTAPRNRKPALPERYATATTSPLIVDVKGGGDSLDFFLQ